MAKVPEYTSSKSLTKDTDLGELPISYGKGQAKAYGNIGKSLSNLSGHFLEIRNLQELTTATANGAKELTETLGAYSQDPDVYNTVEYETKFQEIYNTAAEGISSSKTREKFKYIFNNRLMSAQLKLNDLSRNRQAEYAVGELRNSIDKGAYEYSIALDPEDRSDIMDGLIAAVQGYEAAGLISHDNSIKQQLKLRKDLPIRRIYTVAELDAKAADDLLNTPEYDSMPADKKEIIRTDLKRIQNRAAKQGKIMRKLRTDGETKRLFLKINEGKLTQHEIYDNVANQNIEMADGKKLIRLITDPKFIDAKTRFSAYVELVAEQLNYDVDIDDILADKSISNVIDRATRSEISIADGKELVEKRFSQMQKRDKELIKNSSSGLRNFLKNEFFEEAAGSERYKLWDSEKNDIDYHIYQFHKRILEGQIAGDSIATLAQTMKDEFLDKKYKGRSLLNDEDKKGIGGFWNALTGFRKA